MGLVLRGEKAGIRLSSPARVLWATNETVPLHSSCSSFVCIYTTPSHRVRLIESHPSQSPTIEDGTELRPEWRAWIDHSLR